MLRWFKKDSQPNDADAELALDDTAAENKERRHGYRRNIYADAVVTTHGGTCVNKAVLLDISETGARLRFTNNAEIEGPIWLKIGRFRIELEALPVWRTRTDVGVAFLF